MFDKGRVLVGRMVHPDRVLFPKMMKGLFLSLQVPVGSEWGPVTVRSPDSEHEKRWSRDGRTWSPKDRDFYPTVRDGG